MAIVAIFVLIGIVLALYFIFVQGNWPSDKSGPGHDGGEGGFHPGTHHSTHHDDGGGGHEAGHSAGGGGGDGGI